MLKSGDSKESGLPQQFFKVENRHLLDLLYLLCQNLQLKDLRKQVLEKKSPSQRGPVEMLPLENPSLSRLRLPPDRLAHPGSPGETGRAASPVPPAGRAAEATPGSLLRSSRPASPLAALPKRRAVVLPRFRGGPNCPSPVAASFSGSRPPPGRRVVGRREPARVPAGASPEGIPIPAI
uniref:Uncharacterized protein n=1 Tax=Sphaerodactylus townsendi TaxID=933632 RepID=A0ACB8EQK0_9SAUR